MAWVAGCFRRRLVRVLEPAFGYVGGGRVRIAAGGAGRWCVQLVVPGVSLRGRTIFAELVLLG